MTNTKSKLRALFLTALMVFSVFAGTVAFAGTAAAANEDVTIESLSPTTVGAEEEVEHSANISITGDNVPDGQLDISVPDSTDSPPNITGADLTADGATIDNVNIKDDGDRAVITLSSVSDDITIDGTVTVQWNGPADAATVTADYRSGESTLGSDSADVTVEQSVITAEPGTIFDRKNPDGENRDIGLIKRGESGGLLYNPNEQTVDLEPGDTLVDREGEEYRVTESQSFRGSDGFVGPGATIFQGEEDTQFVGFDRDNLIGLEEQGAEGRTLSLGGTISPNQAEGVYGDAPNEDGAGNTLTVEEPEIKKFEIINEEGDNIAAGESVQENELIILRQDVNFLSAEGAEFGPISRVDRGTLPTESLVSAREVLNDDVGEQFTDQQKTIVRDRLNISPEQEENLENNPNFKTKGREGDSGILNKDITNNQTAPRGVVFALLDLSRVDKPGNYSAIGLSENDEPLGDLFNNKDIIVNQQFTLTAEDDATLNLRGLDDNRSVVQGEFLDFQVESGTKGQLHVVSIEETDLRDRPNAPEEVNVDNFADVFRENSDAGFVSGVLLEDFDEDGNAEVVLDGGAVFERLDNGTVVPTNETMEEVPRDDIRQVFTFLLIDVGDRGIGTIDTDILDDTNVDVNLFDGASGGFDNTAGALTFYLDDNANNEIDEQSFSVEEGDDTLSITNPSGTYVAGEDIDIEGTASTAFDQVALYARDEGDFRLLNATGDGDLASIAVQGDGTWDETDSDLSEQSSVLRVPGTARLGVISVASADLDGDGSPEESLTTSEFASGSSSQESIRVVDQTLDANIRTFNGQVAEEDGTINISGEARGADEVGIVFVDEDGNIAVEGESVDDSNIFDNDDVPLSDRGTDLAEGEIEAFVLSKARDDVFGEPGDGLRTVGALESALQNAAEDGQGLTGEQGAELVREFTIEEDGSDDLIVNETFQLTDASTTIDAVYPAGSPGLNDVPIASGSDIVVEGRTNLKSDDNAITLEAVSGPESDRISVSDTESWNTTGIYQMTLETPDDLEPGNYTLEVDDGETITQQSVRISNESSASISVSDQEVPGGQTVTIDSVTVSQGGYVQVRAGSTDGQALGISAYLSPGTHEDVPVVLDAPLEESTDIVAVAHVGSQNNVGSPYMADGSQVSASATVTIPAEQEQTPTPEPDTPTPEPDTPTPEPDTPTPEPDTPEPTTEPPETTTTSGPGFGAIVALVAAIVAAVGGVVYYRRRNGDQL